MRAVAAIIAPLMLASFAVSGESLQFHYRMPVSPGAGNPPASCKAIQQKDPSAGDGKYDILVGEKSVEVMCDMTTDGGGWTRITQSMILNDLTLSFSANNGVAEKRNGYLFLGDETGGGRDYTDAWIDIQMPSEFDSFYFRNLAWKDVDNGDTWDQGDSLDYIPYSQTYTPSSASGGDVTVGSSQSSSPVLSLYDETGSISRNGQINDVSISNRTYSVGQTVDVLTFRAHEYGSEDEWIYPFYQGSVWIR